MSRKKNSKSKNRRNRRVKHATRNTHAAPAVSGGRKRPGSGKKFFIFVAIFILIVICGVWIANIASPASQNENIPKPSSTSELPAATSSTFALFVTPATIIQGDPVMITLPGVQNLSEIQSATVGGSSGTPLLFTMYEGIPTAFFGANINHALGSTTVTVTVNDGTKSGKRLTATFTVRSRVRPTEPLPVPAQVGGNSAANQIVVADTLDTENAEIAAVPSYTKGAFWTTAFTYPLHPADESDGAGGFATTLKITDPYGFNRDSGEVTIPHMGVDFKAASGTPVYAINDGVVRLTKTFVEYGNTVIVDHGLGIESLYMHLSRIEATPGEVVKKGELLGYSGETGYAVGPHLHLSIKINGISIDPLKFFALFGLTSAQE